MLTVVGVARGLFFAVLVSLSFGGWGPFHVAGGGGGTSGALTTSVTFVNDSGSTMAAGTTTQTFSEVFKKGDVPSGSWPIFTDPSNGHVQKQSYGLDTYWSDGSLKRSTFMLLPDFNVAGSASKSINITCCGSKPGASARALSEVYSQNCIITMPSAPISGSRLGNATGATVSFASWIDSAANTNNNNYKSVKWLDGDAGAGWRIDYKMSATKAGAPQGGLRLSEYVLALTNSSGTLGGFRHMPMVRQPEYNGAAQHFYGFAVPDYVTPANGPNLACNGGAAVPLAWHGGDGNPMVAQTFVEDSNPTDCAVVGATPCFKTSATNNFWFGIGGCQMISFYITTSGGATLPTTSPQIDVDTIYYACSNQSGGALNNILSFSQSPTNVGGSGISVSSAGSGTFTMHPIPIIGPFMRVPFATVDGQYNFFQGTGSLTAESSLRAKFDQNYWLSTKTLPPLCAPGGSACPIQGASNGGVGANAVGDTTFAYDWNPINATDWAANQQAAGDHLDLGPMNGNSVLDFYNQSKLSLREIRMNGLSAGMAPFDTKDATTDVVPNLLSGAYTGMPASDENAFSVFGGGISGTGAVPYPNSEVYGGIQGASLGASIFPEHRPSYSAWPFLRTGELQYLDMLEDVATSGMATVCPNDRQTTGAITGDGIILGYGVGAEFRGTAWVWRDVALTLGFYPFDPTGTATVYNNGGTQEAAYWRQVGLNNAAFTKAIFNPANNVYGSATTYLLNAAKYQGYPATGFCSNPVGAVPGGGTWELGYLMDGVNWYYQLVEDSNALTIMSNYQSREAYVETHFGGWMLYPYVEHNGVNILGSNAVLPPISHDNQFAASPGNANNTSVSWVTTLSPSSSSRAFTQPSNCCSYNPANGDISIWDIAAGNGPVLVSLTTNATTTSSAILHFASVPASIVPGMPVTDTTASFGSSPRVVSTTGTTVTLENTVSAGSGDTLAFSAVMEGQGDVVYYIVDMNTGGGNFSYNLSLTPGGAELPILDTNSIPVGPWFQPASPPALPAPGCNVYVVELTAALLWTKANNGSTAGDAPLANGASIFGATGYNPATNTCDSNSQFSPGSSRYSWQSSFGP